MLKASDLLKIKNSKIGSMDDAETFGRKIFKGVSIDSRKIKKGEIFFAIKGENTDGHKYIGEVIKKGIDVIVLNRKWHEKNREVVKDAACILVDDTTKALGEFANIHRRRFGIPVLCIGGSNGKTTTKDLVSSVLSKQYRVLKSEGNYNNHIGLPLTLFKLKKSHEICVLEVGCNHFGEIEYLCKIAEPQFGLITNIGKEHLEFFGDLNGVAKAEFELYDYLKKKDGSISFFNSDDKFIRKYSDNTERERKFTYSYGYNTDVTGIFKGYTKKFEPVIKFRYKKKSTEASISTFGKHSIYNGLAAATVGLYFGIRPDNVSSALKNFKPASDKRMEIKIVNGIIYINDSYNSNPESVKMGLETLAEYRTKGKKYAVISDMLELGEASRKEHSEIGKYAGKLKLENLFTIGKESGHIFESAGKVKNNIYFKDKESIINMMRVLLKKGDVVYVKGSRGMKMEEVVRGLLE